MAGKGDEAHAGEGQGDQGDTHANDTATAFERVVCYLRARAEACALPGGAGSFDVLVVNERELVVWLTPGREGQRLGEHTIPTNCLAAAWNAFSATAVMDVAALVSLTGSPVYGRWLLALLATLPGVRLDEETLTVRCAGESVVIPVGAPITIPLREDLATQGPSTRGRKRGTRRAAG